MNTVTVDNAAYVPIQYLAATLATITTDAAITKILAQYAANPNYNPTPADTKAVLDTAVENGAALVSNPSLLNQTYTLVMQIIFEAAQNSTTTSTASSLVDEYLPRIAAQLSTEPEVETKAKVALLQFAFGQIEPQNPAIFSVAKAILTLLVGTYQSPQQMQSETFRNVENVLIIVPENVTQWNIAPAEIAHMLNLTYIYTTYTSTQFNPRAILAAAYQQLANFDQATLAANQLLISSIVETFLGLVFTMPSYQVCLDEFLAYESVMELKFTQSDYFKQNFPLFDQLLSDFITTTTIAQVEALVTSPRWEETAKKYQQLNVEVLRTNLISLMVADKIQAGKGYRFTTLQGYLNLRSTDEVEEYIVEATTHGQISTKIDQVKDIIYVSRVVPRRFNPEKSWVELQKRLQYFTKVLGNFATDYKGVA